MYNLLKSEPKYLMVNKDMKLFKCYYILHKIMAPEIFFAVYKFMLVLICHNDTFTLNVFFFSFIFISWRLIT